MMPQTFKDILETLSEGSDLSPEQAAFALERIVAGEVSGEETAAFLFGMRCKGETVGELTAFVRVMRNASVRVRVDGNGAVDLCGTGGDGSGTFNISTAAMFVVAGAGVPVLKHGNRSISSRCGSADVLEKLGVVATLGREGVETVFSRTGMAFMFAPNFHPAMKHVMPARRALKIRTFFNILGPLLNPADVRRQVIGAFDLDTARTMVRILARLETEKAYTLHAEDGLDEVSTTSSTHYFELDGSRPDGSADEPSRFDPAGLGFPQADPADLAGGDAGRNAEIIRAVLENRSTDSQRDIVVLNAAFGIQAAGKSGSMEEAVTLARESLAGGSAAGKLREFSEATRTAREEEGA